MRKGNRMWQIAFGSGFKCNRAVWQALRHVKASPKSPWEDCIHRYPVQVKGVEQELDAEDEAEALSGQME